MDIPSKITTSFNDILVSFDLKQHVTFLTHIHGHWIDLLITRSTCYNIQTPTISDDLSDHHTVTVDVNVTRTQVESKHNVFYRPIHKINIAVLKADILKSDLIRDPKGYLSDLYGQYNQVLKVFFNKHAPVISKSVSQKPSALWMTPKILPSKRRRRYFERVWRKSRSSLDRSRYSKQCHYCNRQMAKAKPDYYTNMVSNNSESPRQLWKCINQIIHIGLFHLYLIMFQSSLYVTRSLVISRIKSVLSVLLLSQNQHNSMSATMSFQLSTVDKL